MVKPRATASAAQCSLSKGVFLPCPETPPEPRGSEAAPTSGGCDHRSADWPSQGSSDEIVIRKGTEGSVMLFESQVGKSPRGESW